MDGDLQKKRCVTAIIHRCCSNWVTAWLYSCTTVCHAQQLYEKLIGWQHRCVCVCVCVCSEVTVIALLTVLLSKDFNSLRTDSTALEIQRLHSQNIAPLVTCVVSFMRKIWLNVTISELWWLSARQREDYQNCSVLYFYCVPQRCQIISNMHSHE